MLPPRQINGQIYGSTIESWMVCDGLNGFYTLKMHIQRDLVNRPIGSIKHSIKRVLIKTIIYEKCTRYKFWCFKQEKKCASLAYVLFLSRSWL